MKQFLKLAVAITILAGIALWIIRVKNAGGQPWVLQYAANKENRVDVRISNTTLHIPEVIVRTTAQAPPDFKEVTIVGRDGMKVPVGTVKFSDFTVLPGRLTLLLDDHTVDIMERSLSIDGKDMDWTKAMEIPIELRKSE